MDTWLWWERGVGVLLCCPEQESLQLLVTAGITGMVLLEDGSDTDPASGGEDGVSLCLTWRNHDPLGLLLALHHPIIISFATRPAGQGAGELQVWCKNKLKD